MTDDPCFSANFRHILNRPEPSRQFLERIPGPEQIRIIRPGEAVTLEYNPRRLNVELDEFGYVENLRCG